MMLPEHRTNLMKALASVNSEIGELESFVQNGLSDADRARAVIRLGTLKQSRKMLEGKIAAGDAE